MTYSLYVDGICVKNGKILLVKRNCEPFKGFWHVVGGAVENSESPQQALKREFYEETGLDVKIGGLLGCRIEESFDRTKIIVFFKVHYFQGQINLNHENQEYNWFSKFPAHFVFDYTPYLEARRL